MAPIFNWLHTHPHLLFGMGILSAVMFFGTLILIPILIIHIPEDYFQDADKKKILLLGHSAYGTLMKAGKNLLGVLLVLAGILMLVLPGQGLLTILIGLILLEFPGRRKLECRIIRSHSVLKISNYIRAKANRPPLKIDPNRCQPPPRF